MIYRHLNKKRKKENDNKDGQPFPKATILWVLLFCMTCVRHYMQDIMHHAVLQVCVNAVIIATRSKLSRHLVGTLMSN